MANLPLLYLSEFTRGSEEEQRSFGFRLANSFAAHGFVKLGSHGVSDDTLARLFQFSRKFFEMSLENKMKAAHPPQPNPHRGYSQVGQEILSRVNGSIEKNQAECQVRDIKVGQLCYRKRTRLTTNRKVSIKVLQTISSFRTFGQTLRISLDFRPSWKAFSKSIIQS